MSEIIVVADYGSQYTQLIARRLRELGVHSEIVGWQSLLAGIEEYKPVGIILSGGPNSVYAEGAPGIDRSVFELGIPVLGICYGMQLMAQELGGEVDGDGSGEYGEAKIILDQESRLFEGLESQEKVWASHGDSVSKMPKGFRFTATGHRARHSALEDTDRRFYGVQFHPEVEHTPNGATILRNFAFAICGCQGGWDWGDYITQAEAGIAEKVGDGKAVVLVSGGVDSTVAAVLAARALGERALALHIDNGLMRKNESAGVIETLQALGVNLISVDATEEFLAALKGAKAPERKRKIIGDCFVAVADRELQKLGTDCFLIQGTLYTDLVESGQGKGTKTATIKSHHNVNSPLIKKWRKSGRLIEPNHEIFKDEVRTLARALDIPEEIAGRQPFPGPGLAIRILGEVTAESVAIARAIDDIFITELETAGVYDQISQALAVYVSNTRSVGVQGDARTYGHMAALRAVETKDFMTAKWFETPHAVLRRISTRITNEVPGINRVVYDISDKPPATTEWE